MRTKAAACVAMSALLVLVGAGPAHGAEVPLFSVTVQEQAISHDPESLALYGQQPNFPSGALTVEGAYPDVTAAAFTLLPESAPVAGTPFITLSKGPTSPPTGCVPCVRWLANGYLARDDGEHLSRHGRGSGIDFVGEEAIYQLAIWIVMGFDDSALPDTRVLEKARSLATKAETLGASEPAPEEPLGASLTLSVGDELTLGQEVRLSLKDTKGRGIPDQLVAVSENRVPARMVRTGIGGQAEISFPYPDDAISVTAQWYHALPAGTFVRARDSQDWLVLAQPLDVSIVVPEEKGVTIRQPNKEQLSEVLFQLFQANVRAWSLGGLIIIIFGLFSFVGLTATIIAFLRKDGHPKRWGLLFILCLIGGIIAYRFAVQQVDVSWASDPKTNDPPVVVRPVAASATSKLSSIQNPDVRNAFCAVDERSGKPNSTAWVSARNNGALSTLSIRLPQYEVVTGLSIVPGRVDDEDNYRSTGRPSRIEVFGENGRMAEARLQNTSWESAEDPVEVTLDRPIPTQILYLRIVGLSDTHTSVGIADLTVTGANAEKPDEEVKPLEPGLTSALARPEAQRCAY